MRRTILCGILLSMLLAGCSFRTDNTQNIPLQSAATGAQIEAAMVVPKKEELAVNISVEIQAKIDPEQDEAVVKARTQAAAIAQAEVAARMQAGSVTVNAVAEKERVEQEAEQEKADAVAQAENEKKMRVAAKERAAAVKKAAKEVQATVKAEIEETSTAGQEKTVAAVQAESGKEAQTAAKVKKSQTTAKAAKEKAATPQVQADAAEQDAAEQDAAISVQVNAIEQDVAIPAQADTAAAVQTVQNEAAVVEISRIYIEDCGSDTGYWEITYSDGHVEYIDD